MTSTQGQAVTSKGIPPHHVSKMSSPLGAQHTVSRSRSGPSGEGSAPREEYSALKQRVRDLRVEHRNAAALRETSRKIEALAVEQVEEEAREREEGLAQHLAASEQNLQQAMARAARSRSLQDRALKCARLEAAKAVKDAEALHMEALQSERQARLAAEAQCSQLEQHLSDVRTQLAEAREDWEEERSQLERRAQDWCQAEILQSRYMAVSDVEAASDVVRVLQQKSAAAESRCTHLAQQLQQLAGKAEEWRESCEEAERKASSALNEAQLLRKQQENEVASLKLQWKLQADADQKRRVAELESLESRFMDVIEKRDATIRDLHSQLKITCTALQGLEREQQNLLDLADH